MIETYSQGREVVYKLPDFSCDHLLLCLSELYIFFCLVAEQVERAFHLALAALLGETVYNFGELVCSHLLW